jgi:Tfp pilus assembly protein PilO
MRFVMPVILIGIGVAVFFVFSDPLYRDVSQLRTQVSSYDEALNNSKALENERDKLTAKYNSINPDNLTKLQKFLPENIDNIRLILEIEQIASPYSMTLKDVKYSAAGAKDPKDSASSAGIGQGNGTVQAIPKDYGIWDLEFSTAGTYSNFLNFTKDLESNLRIVDISSIEFSSNAGALSSPTLSSTEIYKYNFKIKTYWLKN